MEKARRSQSHKSAETVTKQTKKVSYHDQQTKRQKKALRRQKHAFKAYQAFSELLATKGENDPQTIEALESYVNKCFESATYVLDKGDANEATQILEQCTQTLSTKVSQPQPRLRYKILYKQAELLNLKGQHQESLVVLKQAIKMAEDQESMDADPLSCLPAETYLNAAIALQFAERLGEALNMAQNASQASKRAILALSEVQQQPEAFRALSLEDAQNQLMIQLDVEVQAYLLEGRLLDKMNKFEEALRVLQAGKQLLQKHFGPQHPMMSDFQEAEQTVQMQVAPATIDPSAKDLATGMGQVDPDIVGTLLDKRSDLMKRGRVKRVYYQETAQVQSADLRGEFDDLNELEEKEQTGKVNSCAKTQSSWMQRQQLMAMRQQQDEQFRLMELMMSTQKRSAPQCSHPQVYLPMQYNYPVQQAPHQITESSSEPSDSTSEEISDGPPPKQRTPRERTPSPVKSESSVSSKSDSFCCQSEDMGAMKNYLSDDSVSDLETPDDFIEHKIDPLEVKERDPVRKAGFESAWTEKRFKSQIYIKRKEVVEDSPSEHTPSEKSTVDEHRKLSLIIFIQARIRRFLKILRRKSDKHTGLVCTPFYIKFERIIFYLEIYKVEVQHTIKRKRTRHQQTRVRHHGEDHMKAVEDKHEQLAEEETKRMIQMFQVVCTCMTETHQLGSTQVLISIPDFPAEFPFLVDYMRVALVLRLEPKKGKLFQLIFRKLTWSEEQEISHNVHQIMIDIQNRLARIWAMQRDRRTSDLNISTDDSQSQVARTHQIDYESLQKEIRQFETQGHDMEAIRLKIQWEARQLMEENKVTSTKLRKIVDRDVRREREWRDYIQVNNLQRDDCKTGVVRKSDLDKIVKLQALVRGFLARRDLPQREAWTLIFDFVVNQHENYYLVRVYRAPQSVFSDTEYPYQVLVTRYMHPADYYKLRLADLPFAAVTCKQDMIDSVEILINRDEPVQTIRLVRFKKLARNQLEITELPKQEEPTEVVDLQEEELPNEFIEDWQLPDSHRIGLFQIRKFRVKPYFVVTFSYANYEGSKHHFVIDVRYQPASAPLSGDDIRLTRLPTHLCYMVYYIRRHLSIHFNDNRVEYASLKPFKHNSRVAFDSEMKRLREKFLREADELEKNKPRVSLEEQHRLIREELKQSEEELQNEKKDEFTVVQNFNTYVVQIFDDLEVNKLVVPHLILVYRQDYPNDLDFIAIHFDTILPSEAEARREFIKNYLRIYIDRTTNSIIRAAITKSLVEPDQVPIHLVIKIQSVVRMWLVRKRIKREFPGFVARFFMREGNGRRARITVWKTIVQHTVKTSSKRHVKEKKNNAVVNDQVVQTNNKEVKEQIEAFQVVAENVFVADNQHEKIVLTLPPREILLEALREHIVLKWKGTYDTPGKDIAGRDLMADWIVSLSYKKLKEKDYSSLKRYNQKIGLNNNWSLVTDCVTANAKLRLFEADGLMTFEEPFIRITAHLKNEKGVFNESHKSAELVLSLEQVVELMLRGSENRGTVDETVERLSYQKRHKEWDALLKECCQVSSTGSILIDELYFQSKRFGFDPAAVRQDAKAVDAALLLQGAIRRFLRKTRYAKLVRTPGYATGTGVFESHGVYLVFLFRASRDQKQFSLTLKQRVGNGAREPIVERQYVKQAVFEQAQIAYPGIFPLMSILKHFEQLILKSKSGAILSDGAGGRKNDWKEALTSTIYEEFCDKSE